MTLSIVLDSGSHLRHTKPKWSERLLLVQSPPMLSYAYGGTIIVIHPRELASAANKHIYIVRAEATTSKTQLRSGACSFQKGMVDAVTEAVNTLHL